MVNKYLENVIYRVSRQMRTVCYRIKMLLTVRVHGGLALSKGYLTVRECTSLPSTYQHKKTSSN